MHQSRCKNSSTNSIDQAISQVDQLSRTLGQLLDLNAQMAATAKRTGDSGQQTAKVAVSIGEVARATRMLSINASIESARAGEAGAGFTVVATEVGSLANRSGKAASEATALLANAAHDINQLIALTDSFESEINKLSQMQQELESTLQTLSHEIENGWGARVEGEPKVISLTFDQTTMGTGEATIDHQHRKLIDMIRGLDEAVAQGHGKQQVNAALDFLASYVVEHFKHEECVFTQKKCPNSEKNKRAHAQLLQKYTDWRKAYEQSGASLHMVSELSKFLKDWLVGHICGIDRSLLDARSSSHATAA